MSTQHLPPGFHAMGIEKNIPSALACRPGCGACCVAPSISAPIPGMGGGKPAGVRCIQLTIDNRCLLFGRPERPAVCASLRPSEEMCGGTAWEAMTRLAEMERATAPSFACDSQPTASDI